MPVHIVIVEDDEDISDLVAFNLERQGWKTTQFYNGSEALPRICELSPDLVVMDIMLPGMTGLQVYAAMKETGIAANTPVLFLTAKAQLEDRLAGLQLGADDYMTKPFSPKELVLRVRNILNRTQNAGAQLMVRRGDILLDKNSLRASAKGEALDLTTTEFKLLAHLMEREGKLQDRYELQKELFGYADTTQSRALDTHIKRLRQKLGAYATCICTERGVGYYFESKSEQA
ncbi:MAG: response regulator transcription factor [Akkermansia sp.]|nr:response regulator transcription factor [Akkermansia sp.]